MPAAPEPLRFACATFQRVFDVHPVQDALTLPELTDALTRFLVKDKLKERIDHEVALVDAAEAIFWTPGVSASGKLHAALDKARRDAPGKGLDPRAAVADRADHLRADARRAAKRDMRLWAPLLFKPDGERDEADILHVSCLVLDYDGGTPIDEASAAWRPYYHVIHTTWSHTPAHPKLRLVLPLAQPIAPSDFRELFAWAEARTHFAVDPTGSGVSRAHALPVTPSRDAQRQALVAPGELLDPVTLGLFSAPAAAALPDAANLEPCLMRRDPKELYVEPVALDPWDPTVEDDDLWGGGASAPLPTAPAPPTTPKAPASAPPAPAARAAAPPADDERLRALEARVLALEKSALVDGLERLSLLYEQGALDQPEFAAAKARLLAGER